MSCSRETRRPMHKHSKSECPGCQDSVKYFEFYANRLNEKFALFALLNTQIKTLYTLKTALSTQFFESGWFRFVSCKIMPSRFTHFSAFFSDWKAESANLFAFRHISIFVGLCWIASRLSPYIHLLKRSCLCCGSAFSPLIPPYLSKTNRRRQSCCYYDALFSVLCLLYFI